MMRINSLAEELVDTLSGPNSDEDSAAAKLKNLEDDDLIHLGNFIDEWINEAEGGDPRNMGDERPPLDDIINMIGSEQGGRGEVTAGLHDHGGYG